MTMRRSISVAVAFLFLCLLVGCIDSKNPLGTENEATFDESLLGDWHVITRRAPNEEAETRTMAIEKTDKNAYSIKLRQTLYQRLTEGKIQSGPCHLIRLGNHYFVSEKKTSEKGVETYAFYKIAIIGSEMSQWRLSSAWLHRLIKKHPAAIAMDDKTGLLAASSKDLQTFVLSHIDTPGAWIHVSGEVNVEVFGRGPFGGRWKRVDDIPVTEKGLTSKKQRTLDYWWVVSHLSLDWGSDIGDKPELAIAILDLNIRTIEHFSTLGVDLDAVQCALDLSDYLKSVLSYLQDNSGNGRMVEAFVRGFLGDPFGVANEVAAEKRAIDKKAKAAADRCRRARAVLTDRYGLEFPRVTID